MSKIARGIETPIEPVKPIEEPVIEPVKPKTEEEIKAEAIIALKERFVEYPEFAKLTEEEKINVLLVAKADDQVKADLEVKRLAFEEARLQAIEAQRVSALTEVDATRVKVYKEKLVLDETWTNAASTGTWEVPK